MKIHRTLVLALLFAIAVTAPVYPGPPSDSPVAVGAQEGGGHQNPKLTVGSWYGRALPDDPWCTPGTLIDPSNPDSLCPIPREIIMLPTFMADGNFMGIASHEFASGGEAHGTWEPRHKGVVADWLIMEKGPDGNLIGTSHMRLSAEVVGGNRLEGTINAYFFQCIGPDGLAIVDPDTLRMIPDPLSYIGPIIDSGLDCAPHLNGCLGVFKFVIDRVSVQ